jgi:purine-binding chemotaxis protein CheW
MSFPADESLESMVATASTPPEVQARAPLPRFVDGDGQAVHSPEPEGLRHYLMLLLGERQFALPVERTTEVLRMVAITPIPGSQPWLAGVVNVRGRTVPVVDLRVRLGLPAGDPGLRTPIIVIETGGRVAGLIADEVVDVRAVPMSCVEPPDPMAGPARWLSAVVRHGDHLILVLDPDRVVEPQALPPEDEDGHLQGQTGS